MPPGQRVAPQSDGRAGARVSSPAAASPDLTARDFLDGELPGGPYVRTRSGWAAGLSGVGMRVICKKTVDNARRNAKIRP